ncbi:MAG: aminotransferase [Acidimicrobiales bacterium]|nr:MAG: aminotransferase [Acidimicrobiales bacterium]
MTGFTPPPYPYDRLDGLRELAESRWGSCLDLSVGSPWDPPPAAVREALARSDGASAYPPSAGSERLRKAAGSWLRRRFGVEVDPTLQIAACVGTKEFVASLPAYLRLRNPERDSVLYPEVSYPTYAMGAMLAGCTPVAVPCREDGTLRLDAVDDAVASRALCLWVNSPGNPAGGLEDLRAAAEWGRARSVPVISDECYVEFTWAGRPHSILEYGVEGVVALHSLSKRSNMAGIRVGFYSGDEDLVSFLSEVRRHAGLMVPAPAQEAAVAALGDQGHVEDQRERYMRRLEAAMELVRAAGAEAEMPGGGFYLWVRSPGVDAWEFARLLAERAGVLVSPGDFFGDSAKAHVRVAAVRPADQIRSAAKRLRAGDEGKADR